MQPNVKGKMIVGVFLVCAIVLVGAGIILMNGTQNTTVSVGNETQNQEIQNPVPIPTETPLPNNGYNPYVRKCKYYDGSYCRK
jgi:hypothetical protein